MNQYERIVNNKLVGWNTWYVGSMLTHVLMPHGFAIKLGVKEYREGDFLGEALLGRPGGEPYVQRHESGQEELCPEAHALDGGYTRLRLMWRGIAVEVETCAHGDAFCAAVRPVKNQKRPAVAVASAGILWQKPGTIAGSPHGIVLRNGATAITVRCVGQPAADRGIPVSTPYLTCSLAQTAYFYASGAQSEQSADAIEERITAARNRYAQLYAADQYGEYRQAMAETLAWHVIYDPVHDTLKTIVGRNWSREWGGYVQHAWDMFFNALVYAEIDKDYACNSVVEIMREMTDDGFIPNCAAANGFVTLDRSQPPVGSLIVYEIFKRHNDLWFLEAVFDGLYRWNTWYFENRQVKPGVLGWGSKPFEPGLDNYWETAGVGGFYGAAMESGLDNSPMYDHIAVDPKTFTMKLGDVGLTGLFAADIEALIRMAELLGRKAQTQALAGRLEAVQKGLAGMWDEQSGIYLNLHTDDGSPDRQISPTLLYPLLVEGLPKRNARRMVEEHLLNPDELWGEWVIPSISRSHPAFPEQDYWRGRIWPPLNALVYMGLKKSGFHKIAKELAEKSGRLLMKEWRENRHMHENYCALTGEGCNRANSEKYYTWAALLAYIYLDAFTLDG